METELAKEFQKDIVKPITRWLKLSGHRKRFLKYSLTLFAAQLVVAVATLTAFKVHGEYGNEMDLHSRLLGISFACFSILILIDWTPEDIGCSGFILTVFTIATAGFEYLEFFPFHYLSKAIFYPSLITFSVVFVAGARTLDCDITRQEFLTVIFVLELVMVALVRTIARPVTGRRFFSMSWGLIQAVYFAVGFFLVAGGMDKELKVTTPALGALLLYAPFIPPYGLTGLLSIIFCRKELLGEEDSE